MNTVTQPIASPLVAPSTNGVAPKKDNNTITSNDFLTLLVAQMKNQDPTSPSDPSQYMQQLVGVNSLQQLIDMNKQLTSLGGSTTGVPSSTKG